MKDIRVRDLVGRMLMVGFDGESFGPELRDLLLDIRPGGIILFKRNAGGDPRQVAALIDACQDLAQNEFGRPLLVAIDEEGGPVRRLGPPFFQKPSQRRMAEAMTPAETGAMIEACARELSAVGVNFNLAPVLDLVTDEAATFMFERSFGSDPATAADYGRAVMAGHDAVGLLTCAKHFPGIGDTRLDPHEDLPTVDHDAERLRRVEITPFAEAVRFGAAAVMTSHINYPALDPDHPATFSKRIILDLLRIDLGFSGLILTDDLEMGAIVKHYRLGPAAVRTVAAGSDLLLICRRGDLIREAAEALTNALQSGEITTGRLEESVFRFETALARLQVHTRPSLEDVFGSWQRV